MQIVSVMLMDDEVYELSEDFIGRLSLEAGSSGVSIGQDSSVATIEDEDGGCGFIRRVVCVTACVFEFCYKLFSAVVPAGQCIV